MSHSKREGVCSLMPWASSIVCVVSFPLQLKWLVSQSQNDLMIVHRFAHGLCGSEASLCFTCINYNWSIKSTEKKKNI